MKRWIHDMRFSSRGARVHFAVAIALISIIPCLTLFYLYNSTAGSRPLTPSQWMAAAIGIVGAMTFGYVLLGKYPAAIIRLRACLHNAVQGELPNSVVLSANERDITSIEQDLNVVLEKLRSKLHQTQAQNTQLQGELFQARKLEAIGTLAAGIAHEISTPLQFVSNNVQFLGKACRELLEEVEHAPERIGAPGEGREAAERKRKKVEFVHGELPRAFGQVEEGIARVSQIVKAIKDFAKGEENGEKTPTDLNKAVEATIEVTRNKWKYQADLEADLAPVLPPVLCFPGEIKRSLMELVLNAGEAIADSHRKKGPGQGHIRITTRRQGENILLSVSDDGCGIPAAIRDRIFDPFFTTREIGAGKGCGLAFAHSAIVTRHGGRLGFVTEENQGSTFTVLLPLDGGGRMSATGEASA